jgi:hypothetical protein
MTPENLKNIELIKVLEQEANDNYFDIQMMDPFYLKPNMEFFKIDDYLLWFNKL